MLAACTEASRTTLRSGRRGGGGGGGGDGDGGGKRQRGSGSGGALQGAPPSPPPAAAKSTAVVIGPDGKARCPWGAAFVGANSEAYVRYHDEEWGRPIVGDDRLLFELLTLECAQAGLSWATILAKRDAYRTAFAGFDAEKVAAFSEADVERLMAEGSGVVRNRAKITAAIHNARCFLAVRDAHNCSFGAWLWRFAPGGRPVVGGWTDMAQVPAKTPASEALSAALKAEGFKFVGPVTCYALMQAAGLVNDHLAGCFCHGECNAAAAAAFGAAAGGGGGAAAAAQRSGGGGGRGR